MNQFNSKFDGSHESSLGYLEIEKLNQTPESQRLIDEEFGAALEGAGDGFSRRRWLQLMGASLALGTVAGCRYQPQKIVPYAFRPQNRIPGTPVRYASMIDLGGVAHPVEALSYDGRPIKLDGNRLHEQTKNLSENSPGTSTAFTQARILELYDPDRLRSPLKKEGKIFVEKDWSSFIADLRQLMGGKDLAGVAILAEPSASPSQHRLQKDFVARGGSWFTFTSLTDDNSRAGSKAAFGQVVRPQYEFNKARVIVCLDADPLHFDGSALRNSRLFAEGRDADHADQMSRLYCVESEHSITGASADHRMSLPSKKIASFLGSLAAEIGKRKANDDVDGSLPYRNRVLACMAQDLVDHAGAGVIVVGERQPPAVHAAVHKLNEQLGNVGKTVSYLAPHDADRPLMLEALSDLTAKIENGQVKSLVIVGGNPAFDAPYDLRFGAALSKCPNVVHLSFYKNETSELCNWVFNATHPLESWGDGFAHDGSWCLAQPLLEPLFNGRSFIETLASAMGPADVDGLTIVQETAKAKWGEANFETAWNAALHDGFAPGSPEKLTVTTQDVSMPTADDVWLAKWSGQKPDEIVFTASRSVYDGRFANNAWLQELPDFVTKITWDNAALVSPETAKSLGLKQDTLYTFKSGDGNEIKLPVHIQPGQAQGSIAVAIGFGRRMAGAVGGDTLRNVSVGHDVSPLRSSTKWYVNDDISVSTSGASSYPLAVIQANWEIDKTGRDEIQNRMFKDEQGNRSGLLREGSFDSLQKFKKENPAESHEKAEKHATNSTSLPIINNVVYVPDEPAQAHSESHDHHEPKWPAGFHEHELFDLTPGVRSLYAAENPDHKNSWGMSIDLNKCTGCNSCVVACQSENNVPIVGKLQVQRGREMHWIRLDSYFGSNLYCSDADDKQIIHQPVACHHCENAPCETVCPVAATVHSTEGLNDMVYNRCIGTRYCGNNCPYKVRRFNYLNYSDAVTFVKYPNADRLSAGDRALQNLMMNPEVTIRSRGVMEKCSYCVQRIQNTKILAKTEGNRPLRANEITTACQDACPTGAIKFGDINHPDSDVHSAHKNPRAYAMLSELNNIPRTKYLARVRNPHPQLNDSENRSVRTRREGISLASPSIAE